ncbi:MAG: glycosyltransferase family 4 protein [Clostridium butyricum]|nr:glycosyltransferase family 4 protein [Clostridium butyricum]MDU3595949.1 glycosyltransferase family 4 protein [Clostridium butyricum]
MIEKSELLKVCLILPDTFPVPAVCGGAIETLVTSLIKYNNKNKKLDLTICSRYHSEAKILVEKMNCEYTHFLWTNPEKLKNKIKYFIFRVYRKIFKKEINRLRLHYGEISDFINNGKEKFDLIITEGGDYKAVADICLDKYTTKDLAIHVHHHYIPSIDVCNKYGNVIGVSKFVTEEYLNSFNITDIKSFILKNSIDINKFNKSLIKREQIELRKKLGFSEKDFIMLYVGRIIDVKGIKELIKAILNIGDESVKLLIIGSPNFSEETKSDYLDELNNLVNQNRDKIKFTGYIENKNIFMYQSIANIQCVPSVWEEAAGLVVLESMAAGLPTIITKSGGMVEYANKDTSIIVDKENNLVENLSKAIIELKNDNSRIKKMSLASKEHVKQYDEINYYNKFVEIINDIVKVGRDDESRNSDIS